LSDRAKALKLPKPAVFDCELTPEQIEQLFPPEGAPPESGLYIFIEQCNPHKLGTVSCNNPNPNWYWVPSGARYERVVFMFIRGEDENGDSVYGDWGTNITVKHDPFAPVLKDEGSSPDRIYLLTTPIAPMDLFQWDNPISKEGNEVTVVKVAEKLKAILGLGDLVGAFDKEVLQTRVGMPLTGGYYFRIESKRRPKRAKLILVYVSYPQN
jgi:hypothetical protein